jgi:hypothetical protein
MKFSKILGLAFALILSTNAFADEVSAYLVGKYRDEGIVTKTLRDAGFELVASYDVDKKGELLTVVFTSPELQKLSSAEGRGFFAVSRVYINLKDNEIRVANPNYFGHAFLGKDYSKDVHAVTDKLTSAFGDLVGSDDKVEKDDLAEYHFSFGMPYYSDMITIAQGDGIESKISNPIFSLKLSNGATLIGVDLDKRTKKFVKKAGRENGILLPYTVLVEGGKAKILDPKYYLAISYPKLSMSDFMKIATVPDAVEKEIAREFQ